MKITAKELKALLDGVPDNAVVVISLEDDGPLYPINEPQVVQGYSTVGSNGEGGVAVFYHQLKPGQDIPGTPFPLVIL